jgi:hypothetical protein
MRTAGPLGLLKEARWRRRPTGAPVLLRRCRRPHACGACGFCAASPQSAPLLSRQCALQGATPYQCSHKTTNLIYTPMGCEAFGQATCTGMKTFICKGRAQRPHPVEPSLCASPSDPQLQRAGVVDEACMAALILR